MRNVRDIAPKWATHYRVMSDMIVFESLTQFTRYIDGNFDGVTKKIMAHINDDSEKL